MSSISLGVSFYRVLLEMGAAVGCRAHWTSLKFLHPNGSVFIKPVIPTRLDTVWASISRNGNAVGRHLVYGLLAVQNRPIWLERFL